MSKDCKHDGFWSMDEYGIYRCCECEKVMGNHFASHIKETAIALAMGLELDDTFVCDWCYKPMPMSKYGHSVTWRELPNRRDVLCVFCEDKLEQARLDAESDDGQETVQDTPSSD